MYGFRFSGLEFGVLLLFRRFQAPSGVREIIQDRVRVSIGLRFSVRGLASVPAGGFGDLVRFGALNPKP